LKEWTTPDSRNTPSTANLEEEGIVDAPRNDGKASMPEQFKRPNLCRRKMMMMMIMMIVDTLVTKQLVFRCHGNQIRERYDIVKTNFRTMHISVGMGLSNFVSKI
jgi:hypothetical protein